MLARYRLMPRTASADSRRITSGAITGKWNMAMYHDRSDWPTISATCLGVGRTSRRRYQWPT